MLNYYQFLVKYYISILAKNIKFSYKIYFLQCLPEIIITRSHMWRSRKPQSVGHFCFFRKNTVSMILRAVHGPSEPELRPMQRNFVNSIGFFSEHRHLFLFYKTNIRTCNVYNNTVSCLLLHVSTEFCHLQLVCTSVFGTHYSIIRYNSNTYYIALISTAEVQNVRSREMLLKLRILVYRCAFRYCIQTFNRILVPVLCVVLRV